jgi:gamma-carbonic anhydrase
MTIHAFDGHKPEIHADAFVHPDATIIGNCVVGARSSIWPATVLRGDMKGKIVVGEDTSIQDGTVIHLTQDMSETIVGARCTVGHRVILHGCIVEDECLIGMGSIILDNARVGTGSLVGAGALVTQGMIIPPNSLVLGSPAKVVRPLKPKEREMIDGGWKTYVEYSRKYKKELGV